MKKLIAGNWKMNGDIDDARALIADIINNLYARQDLYEKCDFLVCPPFVHISAIRHALYNHNGVMIGAQDCSAHEGGSHTGDVSAAMLKGASCSHVILGHSERRHGLGESNAKIFEKMKRAHEAGLIAILCVGETEQERMDGREEEIVGQQLLECIPESSSGDNTVIAYEPVWAIGTGKTASPQDVEAMHGFIREKLKEILADSFATRILYGGSMKPDNAPDLLATPNVDGGLIGGASLNAQDFLAIAKAA